MYADEDSDPEKWTISNVGGMSISISPDGDSVVFIREFDEAEFRVYNNQRSQVCLLDVDFTEDTPVFVSDQSLREDDFSDQDEDSVYLYLGASLDENGDYLYPVEIRMPKHTAYGIATTITSFLDS